MCSNPDIPTSSFQSTRELSIVNPVSNDGHTTVLSDVFDPDTAITDIDITSDNKTDSPILPPVDSVPLLSTVFPVTVPPNNKDDNSTTDTNTPTVSVVDKVLGNDKLTVEDDAGTAIDTTTGDKEWLDT